MQDERRPLALSLLLALLAAWPALATEHEVCNVGTIPIYAAAATRGSALASETVWRVTGWYEIAQRDCATFDDSGQTLYLSFSFTDSNGNWGAALFDPAYDGPWQPADDDLCVAHDAFDYELGKSSPFAPCQHGWFRLPGTLYFQPDDRYPSYRLDLALTEQDDAFPVDPGRLATLDVDLFGGAEPAPDDGSTRADKALESVLDKWLEKAADDSPAASPPPATSPSER